MKGEIQPHNILVDYRSMISSNDRCIYLNRASSRLCLENSINARECEYHPAILYYQNAII